jgi:hypothetical protein
LGSQALRDWYRILGSADVFGNPVRLLKGVGTSVFNLFYEPAQGIMSNPKQIGQQLALTATVFVRDTGGLVLDAVGKAVRVVSQGVKTLDVWDNRGYVRKKAGNEAKPKCTVAPCVCRGICVVVARWCGGCGGCGGTLVWWVWWVWWVWDGLPHLISPCPCLSAPPLRVIPHGMTCFLRVWLSLALQPSAAC